MYTGISNQLTSLCPLILWKLLTLDLLSNTPISRKDKTITLVHLSICLMKLSMTIFTASKVIYGRLVSFSMKCLLAELHGEQKLNLISKECSKPVLLKIYFHQKSLKFQNNSLSNHSHTNHKIECHLKKFSDSLKDLHQTLTLEFNQKRCCRLPQELHSEQELHHKIQQPEIQPQLNSFWTIISVDLRHTKKLTFWKGWDKRQLMKLNFWKQEPLLKKNNQTMDHLLILTPKRFQTNLSVNCIFVDFYSSWLKEYRRVKWLMKTKD